MALLERTIAEGNRGHVGVGRPSLVMCVDGFHMSVIAGGGTYCSPAPGLCTCGYGIGDPVHIHDAEVPHDYPGPYTHVEVGFPSGRPEPWEVWSRYAEQPEEPLGSVYAQVPVGMVRELVELHGGECQQEQPWTP